MFLITAVTFKNCIRSIQVFDKINPPKLFLVRNQCDKFKSDEEFQSCVTKDNKVLEDINIKREILYISCLKGDNFKDNARFKRLMRGKQ